MITDKCWSQKNEEIKYMLINLYVGTKTEVCKLILTQVLVSEYFKKIDTFDIIYNNFYNGLLSEDQILNRTESYSLQCYPCPVEMLG